MRFYRFLVSEWNPEVGESNSHYEYAESLDEIKELKSRLYSRKNEYTCLGLIQVAEYAWKYLDREEVSHTEQRGTHDE